MSQLKNQLVLKCIRCGAPVILSHLQTSLDDPNGELLIRLAQDMQRVALCPNCQKSKEYYAEIGKSYLWESGNA